MHEKSSESSEFFDKAAHSLREATVLTREGLFDGAVSRAYYAAFQAASGALLARGKRFKSHNGVHSAFAEEFVRTGLYDRRMSRILGTLYELRFAGDYGDHREITETDAVGAVADATEFVEKITETFDRLDDGAESELV